MVNILIDKIKIRIKNIANSPARVIVFSFLLVILLGTLLLMLPISSKSNTKTSFLASIFTATSATCVTGLTLFDTYSHWNLFGQTVILALIQIGGIGLVTITIFFYVVAGKKISLKGRYIAKESVNIIDISNLSELFKFIISVTLSIEMMGAAILNLVFVSDYGLIKGSYISLFLSISAFCNAGFDVLGFQGNSSSLINYNDNPIVIYTIGALVILGGLGFIVWYDLFNRKKRQHLMLHTKVVLIMSMLLLIIGAILFACLEWYNSDVLYDLTLKEKINASVFQSITIRTAGFSSINFSKMRQVTKVIFFIIMFIGGAPGSTSGGIKITTFAVLVMTVVGVMKNKSDTVILGRKVEKNIVYKSLSIFFMSIILVFLGSIIIYYTVESSEVVNVVNSVFETISAFSTVGVSTGVTVATNEFGRVILIIIMFIGRVGPISLLLSLAMKAKESCNKIIPEGKIMVG